MLEQMRSNDRTTIKSITFVIGLLLLSMTGCSYLTEKDLVPLIPQVRSFTSIGNTHAWFIAKRGALWRTESAGNKWEKIDQDVSFSLLSISFVDTNYGWGLGGKGQIWQTNDGGRSWSRLARLDKLVSNDLEYPIQVKFVDRQNGWLIAASSVWHTEDGGRSWKESEIEEISSYYILSGSVGWIGSPNSRLYFTEDNANEWQPIKISNSDMDIDEVGFSDVKHGWAAGYPSGLIFCTDDGGKHWSQLSSLSESDKYYVKSVFFISKKSGWAVGSDKNNNTGGVVLQTNDEGRTWEIVQIGHKEPFFDRVFFEDKLNGWIFGHNNLYRTDDGGQKWRIAFTFSD